MGKLIKKTGKLIKKGVGLGTLGLVGDMPGHQGPSAAARAAAQAAADLAERNSTPVMPDEEALKRSARRRLAGSLGRSGRASTFLSDPSEGL